MNIGVILAAGLGVRFHSNIHKQYLKLNGKEVFFYTLKEMQKSKFIHEILLVVDEDEYKEKHIEKKYNIKCILGGSTRNISIGNALNYISENYSCKNVIFHDAVRPFAESNIFDEYMQLLDDYDAVFTTTSINDSLAKKEGLFVNRKNFFLVQTPEAFRFKTLKKMFNPKSLSTAIVNQLKGLFPIKKVENPFFNMKITYPEDLFLAEQLMRIKYYRLFYSQSDLEKLQLGRVLLLGGTGGIGSALKDFFYEKKIEFLAPTRTELDLRTFDSKKINDELKGFVPDVIINAAAFYANDSQGILKYYDAIFDVNLKANLILMEYAESLKKPINIVLISSSSSTKGRENLTNYSASKAALNSIVESRASSLAQKNIFVNVIIPEKINTSLIAKLHGEHINPRELLDTKEVIQAIVKYASSTEYGQLIHVRKGM